MNHRLLSWLWFVPPTITIAAGVWTSTSGAGFAEHLTQEARSWQDRHITHSAPYVPGPTIDKGKPGRDDEEGTGDVSGKNPSPAASASPSASISPTEPPSDLPSAPTSEPSDTPAQEDPEPIRLSAGPGNGHHLHGASAAVTFPPMAAGDTVKRALDLKITGAGNFNTILFGTEATEKNALTDILRVKIVSCTADWVVESPYVAACPGQSEVLAGDAPLVGNTFPILDRAGVKPGKTKHLLLELRLPSDADNSAAGKTATLTFHLHAE